MKNEIYRMLRPAVFTYFSAVMLITALNLFMFSSNYSYGNLFSAWAGDELFINKTESVKVAGNIYEKPTAESIAIARAQKGETLTLLVLKGEWYVVKLSTERLGWAHRNLFSDISMSPTETERTQIVPERNISDVPALPAETERTQIVPDKKVSDMPALPPEPEKNIIVPDKKEPLPPMSSETSEKKIMLKVSAGRVRETPSVQSAVKSVLVKGDTVSLVRTEQDWYLVRLPDGTAGWAHSSLFSEPIVMIKSIRFDVDKEGNENVIFALNGYYSPAAFVLGEEEKEDIKVVCDFFNAQLEAEIGRSIEVNGKAVQRIRIGVHENPPNSKIRVVVDLGPDYRYEVGQLFAEKENFYILVFKIISDMSGDSR